MFFFLFSPFSGVRGNGERPLREEGEENGMVHKFYIEKKMAFIPVS